MVEPTPETSTPADDAHALPKDGDVTPDETSTAQQSEPDEVHASAGAGSEEELSNEESESEGDAADTDAAGSTVAAAKKKKRRRKKKKPAVAADGTTPDANPNRPSATRASDRAPFRVGEEVYGKVTAVLDHAIMIDLSGKALAI
ncbi:MAG TPA: hypothetical protein VKP30_21405, partial [Polyangiaceae bacterium]|nr:hypothetical protein [Polyangiaceae bacterium]